VIFMTGKRGRRWREAKENERQRIETKERQLAKERQLKEHFKEAKQTVSDIIESGIDPGKLGAIRDLNNRIVMYGNDDSYCCSRCLTRFDEKDIDRFITHTSNCRYVFDSDGLYLYKAMEVRKVTHSHIMGTMIRFHEMASTERRLRLRRKYRSGKLPWRKKGIFIMYILDGRPIGMIVTELVTLPVHPTTNYFYNGPYKLCVLLREFSLVAYSRRHGIGKEMFDTMLDHYKINPNDIIYRYPSVSFVGFIKKWYGIKVLNVLDS